MWKEESHGFVEVEAKMHVKVFSLFGLVDEPAKFHRRILSTILFSSLHTILLYQSAVR